MDWSHENWIKLYTRDTYSWLRWSWESRAVFCLLLRKVDRSGALGIEQGGASAAVSLMLGVPKEVADRAIEQLLGDGTLRVQGHELVIPNFVAAQRARTSDRLRKQMSRELSQQSQPVTDVPIRVEKSRVEESREELTPYSPPGDPPQKSRKGKKSRKARLLDKHRADCERLWQLQEVYRAKCVDGGRPLKASDKRLTRIAERLEDGATMDECKHVLRMYAANASADPNQQKWFNGDTHWRADNFDRTAGQSLTAELQEHDPEQMLQREKEYEEWKRKEAEESKAWWNDPEQPLPS